MEQEIYDNLPGREKEKWVKLTADPRIKPMYYLSTYGRIKNEKGKILRPDKDKDGYLKFTLQSVDGKKIKRFSHRLVGMQFIPNPENKPEINHIRVEKVHGKNICNNTDNYYCNLEWTTRKENITHSLKNELEEKQPVCQEAYVAIFDDDTIHFICLLMEKGYTNKRILKALGFNNSKQENYERFRGLIKHIRSRNSWTAISNMYKF